MSFSITNSTTNSASDSPPEGAAHTPISADATMQEIENLGQQTLAKRKANEQHPVSFKVARQENEDALVELWNLHITQLLYIVDAPDDKKFAELVSKVIQTPIEQKDLYRLLGILHADQLPFLKKIALSNASKKDLLTLVAQVLRFRIMDFTPSAQSQKSSPYQPLLPLMQWLFESKTDQLSKDDEEALANALCLFSLDTTVDEEFNQNVLPLISATRAILPAAWNRLATFPLSVETFIPALVLLGLKDREVEWTDPSFPKLPEDAAYNHLREKLKTVTDPRMCCALLLELSRPHEIWNYLPLSSELVEDLWNLYQRCASPSLPAEQKARLLKSLANVLRIENAFRDKHGEETKNRQRVRFCMHVLNFAAESCDILPISTCLAGICGEPVLPDFSEEQQNDCLSRISLIFRKLGQNKICLADLARVNWLLFFLKEGDRLGFREPLLKLIQQYDRNKPPAVRIDPLRCLQTLRKISREFSFDDQHIREIFNDLICALESGVCREREQLFHALNECITLKGDSALSAEAENALCTLYEKESQEADDHVRIYGLLVLAQFLPRARFQQLASDFIRDALNIDLHDPGQTFAILLKALYDTCPSIEINSHHDEKRLLKPLFDLVTTLVTSIVDPRCATAIFSHLLLLSINYELEAEDIWRVPMFLQQVLQLAKKHKLPPLTPEASSALQAWIEQDDTYMHLEKLQGFAEHPELKLLLPKQPAHFVQRVKDDIASFDIEFWDAVRFLTEFGYLKGIDAAASMSLQEAICSSFDDPGIAKLSIEQTTSIHEAMMALNTHKCLNLFPKEMVEEEQNAKRTELDQLLQKITNRFNSFSRKME